MADPARGTAKELCELGRSRRTQKIFRDPSVAHRPRVGPITRASWEDLEPAVEAEVTAFSGLYMNWKKPGVRAADDCSGLLRSSPSRGQGDGPLPQLRSS
jgi:hypothetical protein